MTGYEVQQSTTSYPLMFLMVLSSDHITGATGLSPTVTLSKNGGSFASPAGAVTEVANGWYKVAGNATDTNTLGPLALHASVATADPVDLLFPIVAVNPQDAVHYGLTALPNAVAGTSGGLLKIGTSPLPASGTLAAATWDEINTGATHNLANSTGKQLRSVSGNTDVIYSSILPSQAGVATNQVKLDTGASSANSAYVGDRMSAVGAGTGQGSLICIAYVGSTRLATLNSTWTVVPIASDTVEVTPAATAQVVSYIAGQDPATLVLDAAQSSHDTAGTIGHDIGLISGGGTVDANIVSSAINVPAILADGVAHGGTAGAATSSLNLKSVNVTNLSNDDAFVISGNNALVLKGDPVHGGRGLEIQGAVGFEGMRVSGDAGASAAQFNAGLNAGGAVEMHGNGSASGIWIEGDSSPAILITIATAGHGISVLAAGAGKKAMLLAGDVVTDSFAIAAGAGSPIDVFDAQARVTGSATLLDATPTTDPAGVASTFPQMLVQVWRYCFKRKTKAVSGLTIKTYADDNTTVNTTQPYTDDGAGNQSQGPAV